MELTELLKKFKRLEPDRDYSRKSRAVVLSQKHGPVFVFSAKEIVMGIVRSGWSMALTVVLLFLAIGSFSILKIISPATTAVVDVTGLKAEAQAIDAQIQLTNISYSQELSIENKTSTVSMVLRGAKGAKTPADTGQTSAAAVNASTTDEIINSALNELSR